MTAGSRKGRWGLAVGLLALILVGGCASLPDSSAPQAIGTIAVDSGVPDVEAPTPGREPNLLLRDFFEASTAPANGHLAARQYLTPGVSGKWDDAASTTIVDKIDVLPEQRNDERSTYTIRANKVGRLEPGGLYVPEEGSFETEIGLVKVDGEWRIDQLPAGVIMDRTQFLNSYERKSLYFLDPSGSTVVPDPRWVSGVQAQMVSALVGLMIDGPNPVLEPAVRNALDGASVRGPITKADGRTRQVGVGLGGVRIDFEGLGDLDEQARREFAAQVVWTLANSDISGPYVILADGEPLDERFPNGWTTADVASMNPSATPGADVGLHALRDGTMVKVVDSNVTPVSGFFGTADSLRSVGLSANGDLVAAVSDTGRAPPEPTNALMVGTYGQAAAPALEGGAITRPTWAPDGSAVWAVINGNTVVRVLRDPGTGRLSVVNVEAGEVASLGTNITEMRLSRDGVRAALIVDGKVYTAVVVEGPDGTFSLTNPRPVALGLGSPALSLDWSDGKSIVVARAANDTPVVQVAVDGSRMDALPSRNLTTPVISVDASSSTEFVADSRAVFKLSRNDPGGDRYWREVPGLTGIEAVPILPG
ncbi:MAG: MtrAB system accessory protein LpqB [Rhodococcus sp.]|nr:MtrAB system accessory protein LpqB [Rhodococcus sp. (in: high G+C Gram-positive bacteria)]